MSFTDYIFLASPKRSQPKIVHLWKFLDMRWELVSPEPVLLYSLVFTSWKLKIPITGYRKRPDPVFMGSLDSMDDAFRPNMPLPDRPIVRATEQKLPIFRDNQTFHTIFMDILIMPVHAPVPQVPLFDRAIVRSSKLKVSVRRDCHAYLFKKKKLQVTA